jgi:1,4-alpha-glucan branching enzyme
MRRPAEARAGGNWADTDRWEWLAGPNRAASIPAADAAAAPAPGSSTNKAPAAAASPSLVVPLRVSWIAGRDGTGVIACDAYLEPHREHLRTRHRLFAEALAAIEGTTPGGLDAFSRGWEVYGLNRYGAGDAAVAAAVAAAGGGAGSELAQAVAARGGIVYREWAPGAAGLSLVGDFNGWNPEAHRGSRDGFGVWTVVVPDGADGSPGIRHGSHIKTSIYPADSGSRVTRLPAWVRYATYDAAANEYCGVHWEPPAGERHAWCHPRVRIGQTDDYPAAAPGCDRLSAYTGGHRTGAVAVGGAAGQPPQPSSSSGAAGPDPAPAGLRIYEAHVGMGGEEPRVHTYREFADDVLPRVKAGGYNVVQLMAVMEHAYYGSFGYHVTSFLAPSSRFGTPEDLKYLVDAAHGHGLAIIMDLVHSHASKNVNDGLNRWDGTDHHYFHAGPRGNHDLWDSRLFDYSKPEVQRFLLSSARLFVEEYRFDGYRFDGITSMMYHHHGLSFGFSGDYNEYFGEATDLSAMTYLMLANHMLHCCDPPALTIAEDVSGMPTLGRPVWEGGVGFDYRLAMALPDLWIKYLKELPDDAWDLSKLAHTLTNRRWQERTIAYAESHDQALVGDKTLAFWLMDKEMYWHMSTLEVPAHPVVDRGVALHKMIRLVTYALGGDAWLNFMGNEFGHPEWMDFPREGNGWSYQHCRR